MLVELLCNILRVKIQIYFHDFIGTYYLIGTYSLIASAYPFNGSVKALILHPIAASEIHNLTIKIGFTYTYGNPGKFVHA